MVTTHNVKRHIYIFYFIYHSQMLTSHYEQMWKYYSYTGSQDKQKLASEGELQLSRKLFWGVFKALTKKVSTE